MNTTTGTTSTTEAGPAGTDAAARAAAQLDKLMETRQYTVRHRCGAPVRIYQTRDEARTAVDQVAAPARHQLRVVRAERADFVATLSQRHCPHIPR